MKYIYMILLVFSLVFVNAVYAKHKHKNVGTASGGSSMPQQISATGRTVFIFNPRSLSWAAYGANGIRAGHGKGNGGSNYCPDIHRRCHTPVGTFRLASKGEYGCKSTRYPIKRLRGGGVVRGGAHMPYCMYFTTNFAIHGYSHLENANVSHGCIRVSNAAAQWLHSFLQVGSKVVIMSY